MTNLLHDLQFAWQMGRKLLMVALLAVLVVMLSLGAPSRLAAALSQIGSAEAERLTLVGLSLMSALAMGFVTVGIYGVMTYSVTPCTREIGHRLALGAKPSEVVKLILWQGVKLALLGTVIGLAAAFLLAHWLKVWLFGLSAMAPLTFTGVAIVLGAVAFIAWYLPARRATAVQEMIAVVGE